MTKQDIRSDLAFVYARVSTKKQSQADLSVPDQLAQCRSFAHERGCTDVREFIDAKTGTTGDRTDFKQMVEQAKFGSERPAYVIVHSFSRAYRDAVEFEVLFRDLRKRGVSLVSATQPTGDDDANARMMRGIITLFDEHHSMETSKHVRRTMKENAAQGYWNGSTPPYGYETETVGKKGAREKKRLRINPKEAEVVELMANLRLGRIGDPNGVGVKAVCAHLNDANYRTRRGALWGVGTVHKILSSTTYIGKHVYNRSNSRTGEARQTDEHVIMECPAILSVADHERLRQTFRSANPKSGRPRAVAGPVLLSELATCAQCGASMTATTGTGNSGKIYTYYSCASKLRVGDLKCTGVRVSRDRLDKAVMSCVREQLLHPGRLAHLLSSLKDRYDDERQTTSLKIARLEDEVRDAEAGLANLYGAIISGAMDANEPTLQQMQTDLKANRDRAQAALDGMVKRDGLAAEVTEAQVVRFGELLRERLNASDVAFTKGYLRLLLDRVEVGKARAVLVGREDAILAAIGVSANDNTFEERVRSYVPKWRTQQDSNLRPLPSEGSALSG